MNDSLKALLDQIPVDLHESVVMAALSVANAIGQQIADDNNLQFTPVTREELESLQ